MEGLRGYELVPSHVSRHGTVLLYLGHLLRCITRLHVLLGERVAKVKGGEII